MSLQIYFPLTKQQYEEIIIPESTFYNHPTTYYTYSNLKYHQCGLDDEFIPDQKYYILSDKIQNKGCYPFRKIINNNTTLVTSGKIGGCHSFNGTSSKIYTTDLLSNSSNNLSNLTICFWFKANSTSGTQQLIGYSNGNGSISGHQFGVNIVNNQLVFIGGGVNTVKQNINANQWYHCLLTYNSSRKLKAYINGNYVGTLNGNSISNPRWFVIGAMTNSGQGPEASVINYYNGLLADIRVYNSIIPLEQIKEMSKGLVVHYRCDMVNQFENTGSDNYLVDDNNNETLIPVTNGNISFIPDCSGYQNHGFIVGDGLNITNDCPILKHSFSLNNTTIQHSNVLDNINQEWTCCAWIKPTTAGGYQNLNNFNSNNRIYHGTYPLLYLNSGTNDYYNYGNLAVPANQWTHIAFVFKNSEGLKKIYINGELRTNTSGPNKTSTPSGLPSTISIGGSYTGKILDYREYATALTDSDIKNLCKVRAKMNSGYALQSYNLYEYTEEERYDFEHGIELDTPISIKKEGEITTTGFYELGNNIAFYDDSVIEASDFKEI